MSSLKNLIQLIGNEDSKVFVVDEEGNVKAVMLGISEYQRLLGQKLKRAIDDVEKVNREILQAQLTDETPAVVESAPPESLSNLLSQRAATLFRSAPGPVVKEDIRSEVIDPNFDFSVPASDPDDEVIRPGFDDI
jgi:hypothetical protein